MQGSLLSHSREPFLFRVNFGVQKFISVRGLFWIARLDESSPYVLLKLACARNALVGPIVDC